MNSLQLTCQCLGCPYPANHVRLPTQYHDEDSNWADLCVMHEREADTYWKEQYDEYYAGLLI